LNLTIYASSNGGHQGKGAKQVNLVLEEYYSHIPDSQEYFWTVNLDEIEWAFSGSKKEGAFPDPIGIQGIFDVYPKTPLKDELTGDIVLFSPIIGPRTGILFFPLKSLDMRSFSCLTAGLFFRYS
jgi:hypothetical protein